MKEIQREFGISDIAHRIWIEEGKPDGEMLVEHNCKMIPLRELHWHRATVE